MTRTRIACLLFLLGALVWIGRLAIDVSGSDPDAGLGTAALWAGAILLTLGAALGAFDSVNHAPMWLQLVVGLCAPLALWMLLLAGNDMVTGSQAVAGGIFGGVVGLIALVVMVKSQPPTKEPVVKQSGTRRRGTHRD